MNFYLLNSIFTDWLSHQFCDSLSCRGDYEEIEIQLSIKSLFRNLSGASVLLFFKKLQKIFSSILSLKEAVLGKRLLSQGL